MVDKGFPAKGLEDLRCRVVQGFLLAGYNLYNTKCTRRTYQAARFVGESGYGVPWGLEFRVLGSGCTQNEVMGLLIRVLWGFGIGIGGVIRRVTLVISHIRGVVTPFMVIHEPPSRGSTD